MKMKLPISVMVTVNQRKDQMTLTETSLSMYQAGEILKIRLLELTAGTQALLVVNMMFTIYSLLCKLKPQLNI
jgi:hypothetical protein